MESLPEEFISTKAREKEGDSLQAELEKYKRPLIPQESFEKPQLKATQQMGTSDLVGPARPDTNLDDISSSSDDDIEKEFEYIMLKLMKSHAQ